MILTDPWLLAIGLALTALALVGLHSYGRRRRRLAAFLGGRRALERVARSDLSRLGLRRILLVGVAGSSLAIAISEPHRVEAPEPQPPVQRVVLAVDVSASMQAEDGTPTRLASAVTDANELLDSLPEAEVGLLVFAGTAYPLAPPTLDHDAIRFLLGGMSARLASAQDPGTVLSTAIEAAVELFEREVPTTDGEAGVDRGEERALLIFSDGDTDEPDEGLDAALALAGEANVTIHTVGLGTEQGSAMSMPSGVYQLGGPVVDASGAPAISHFDASVLRRIATDGGGGYAYGRSPTDVVRLAAELDSPRLDDEPAAAQREPLWARYDLQFLLGAVALALVLLESLLGFTIAPFRFRALRTREAS